MWEWRTTFLDSEKITCEFILQAREGCERHCATQRRVCSRHTDRVTNLLFQSNSVVWSLPQFIGSLHKLVSQLFLLSPCSTHAFQSNSVVWKQTPYRSQALHSVVLSLSLRVVRSLGLWLCVHCRDAKTCTEVDWTGDISDPVRPDRSGH